MAENKIDNPVASCHKPKRQLDESKTRNIQIKCKHKRNIPHSAYVKVIELVPDINTATVDETITITWTGNDPKPPSYLDISTGKTISGPPYIVNVNYFNDRTIAEAVYPPLYKKNTDPSNNIIFGIEFLLHIYTLNYNAGMVISGFPWGDLDIRIYNPDQLEVKIEFPTSGTSKIKKGVKLDKQLGKDGAKIETKTYERKNKDQDTSLEIETTYKKETAASITTKTTNVQGKSKTTESTTWEGDIHQGGPDKKETSVEREKQIITFKKNGVFIDVLPGKIISFVFKALKVLKKIQDILKDIPKFGAYWEFEASILTGSFTFKYGYKEWSDHRVYKSISGIIDVTILQGKFELGVGISAFSFKLQIYAAIEGELKITETIERNQPYSADHPLHTSVEVKSSLVGKVGARFEALYFVKIEPVIKIEFVGILTFDFCTEKHMAEVLTTVKFSGITADLEASYGPSDAITNEKISQEKKGFIKKTVDKIEDKTGTDLRTSSNRKESMEIMKEKILWQSKYPDDMDKHLANEDISDEEIKNQVDEMINGYYLNSGWWTSYQIRVLREKTDAKSLNFLDKMTIFVGHNEAMEEMEHDEVVNMLFSKICEYKHLDKSKESIQLLLLEIRNELTKFYHTNEKNYVHWDEYHRFIRSKLSTILSHYIDNGKVFKSKYKNA